MKYVYLNISDGFSDFDSNLLVSAAIFIITMCSHVLYRHQKEAW